MSWATNLFGNWKLLQKAGQNLSSSWKGRHYFKEKNSISTPNKANPPLTLPYLLFFSPPLASFFLFPYKQMFSKLLRRMLFWYATLFSRGWWEESAGFQIFYLNKTALYPAIVYCTRILHQRYSIYKSFSPWLCPLKGVRLLLRVE